MKYCKFKFYLLSTALILGIEYNCIGQTLSEQIQYMYSPLDKGRIQTGMLLDYGVFLSSPYPFNGILTDSSYTTIDAVKNLYSGLYTSIVNSSVSIVNPDTFFERISTSMNSSPSELLIPVIYFNTNRIKSNALDLGLLTYQNGQFHDVPGSATPYEAFDLFAASPVKSTMHGGRVNFKLQSDLYITNTAKSVTLAEIDPNDGGGYRSISFNSPLSITYTTFGEKVIKIAFSFSDGKKLYSQFKLVVDAQIQKSPADYSDFVQPFDPVIGRHSGGKAYVKYSSTNTAKKLKRPLIVAEGFDPSYLLTTVSNMSMDGFQEKLKRAILENGQSFYTALLNNYDIVYLDYTNGVDDIFRNARLFEDVIAWVNGQKAGVTGAEPNVVMGISMGGLVSKIALRRMEVEGGNHDTRLFISFDSPHKGANVPPAYQALVWHVNNLVTGVFVDKEAYMLARSTATKQLLKLYVDYENGTFTDSYSKSFMTSYESYSFPTNCRNIAVVNGSNYGNTLFNPYTKLLGMNSKMGDISFKINAYSLPEKKVSTVYDGLVMYCKKVGGTVVCIDFLKQFKSSTATLPYDGAPGGFYDISFFGQLPPAISNYVLQPRFCFVPIASALAIGSTNPLEVLGNQDLIGTGKTPFASYFAQSANELHTSFTSQNAKYILNELAGIACLPTNNASIIGQPVVCSSGTAFTVNNLPSGYSVSWTSSANLNPSSTSGNPVTFSANGNGAGWVQAMVSSGCGNVTLPQKTVWVGSPRFNGTSVTGPTQLTPGLAAVYSISPAEGFPSYNWTTPSGCYTHYCWGIVSGQGTTSVHVRAGAVGSGAIRCTATNTCGTDSRYIYVNVQNPQDPDPCDELTLSLSPNPNRGGDVVVQVIYPPDPCDEALMSSSPANVTVIDNMGNMVYSRKHEGSRFELSGLGLKKGVYHIIYIKNNKRFEKTMLVE
ncbi:MAG: hypothetical protein AB7S54_07980 [Bacteroidales bacterium]